MAFLSKAESLELAKELGIENAEKLPWAELQSLIAERKKANDSNKDNDEAEVYQIKVEEIGDPTESKTGAKLEKPKKKTLTGQYYGKDVMISPELPPERYRLLKYDEELGNDIEVEERSFHMDPDTDRVYDISGGEMDYRNKVDSYHDYTTGTYRLKSRSNRKVTAMSSVPKENYGSGMKVGVDYVPVVTWNGRAGYLWTHPTFPNVKALLQESGYYHEYKDRFTSEPNIWYAAGKTLVCDIGLVNSIFKEIENRAQKRIEEERAYRERLGL
jgi:hypothetical protein